MRGFVIVLLLALVPWSAKAQGIVPDFTSLPSHIGGIPFIHWGMTLDEVRHANEVIDIVNDTETALFKTPEVTVKLRMPWKSGRYLFACYFGFDDHDMLAVVIMIYAAENVDVAGGQLFGSLLAKYGTPNRLIEKPTETTAIWLTDDTAVTMRRLGDDTSIAYFPRFDVNNAGL